MGFLKLGVAFTFICLFSAVNAASILALFSSLSFSDHLVFRGYVSQLVQRGHSVVVMTAYPGKFPPPVAEKIIELDVGKESGQFWQEYKTITTNTDDYFPRQRAMNELSLKIAIAQLRSKQMTALLINPNIKFDLVIAEADIPVLYAFAEKYKCPLIAFTASDGRIHQHEAKGNPVHPLLYLDVHSLSQGNDDNTLSFWQKITELYRHIKTRNEYYYNYLPLNELAAKKILGVTRDLQDVEREIDVLLIASNPILTGSRPTVPAVAYVDRLHIKPPYPLPQDFLKLLDSAVKGVVYFSLGALQESESLATGLLQTLSEAFSELPYTILWKIGNTTMINKPGNVIAQPWFLQQEVLAHPNVKAFITSGGTRSLEEAVFYKVPVIGFPIIKSRKSFIAQITKFGAGEILDPYTLDKETLKSTITEVITNKKYHDEISKLCDAVFNPVISGPENALRWTEYVLRYNGAKHLQSSAAHLAVTKYFMFDVLFYTSTGLLILLFVSFIILRFIVRRVKARYYGFGVESSSSKFKAL